jgi:hypothetical protein
VRARTGWACLVREVAGCVLPGGSVWCRRLGAGGDQTDPPGQAVCVAAGEHRQELFDEAFQTELPGSMHQAGSSLASWIMSCFRRASGYGDSHPCSSGWDAGSSSLTLAVLAAATLVEAIRRLRRPVAPTGQHARQPWKSGPSLLRSARSTLGQTPGKLSATPRPSRGLHSSGPQGLKPFNGYGVARCQSNRTTWWPP